MSLEATNPELNDETGYMLPQLRVVSPTEAVDAPAVEEKPATATTITGYTLDQLLQYVVDVGASDLHLQAGLPPTIRRFGRMRAIPDVPSLSADEIRAMAFAGLKANQQAKFEVVNELNFAYEVPGMSRYRGNLSRQMNTVKAVYRHIPWEIPDLAQLGIPPVVARWTGLRSGLIVVTGETGAGKSSTLAGMLDLINTSREGHIITIEDPVEFVHASKQCMVAQREVGEDTESFAAGAENALRQDPDVIMVGEIKDPAGAAAAITLADTGHLVLATLHTASAEQTINRILDLFTPEEQPQIRSKLSTSLQGILCQQLLPVPDGEGRVACCEVLTVNNAIRNLIRKDRIDQIKGQMEMATGIGREAEMITRDQYLALLVRESLITVPVALPAANQPDVLARHLGVADEDALRALPSDAFRPEADDYWQ